MNPKKTKKGVPTMKDLSLYNPDVCDGDFCPLDCEHCYKRDRALEAAEEGEEEEDDAE